MGIYDPTAQFTGGAEFAINGWMSGWKAQPVVMPIEPWWRPGDLTFVQPAAKLVTRQSIPIHAPGVEPWNGAWTFGRPTGKFIECKRALFQKGTKANTIELAEFDVGAFSMAPAAMAIELGNNPGIMLAAILNGCYSGTPQDSAGNALPAQLKLIGTDQVYGGNLAVKSGDSANYKLVNPGDPTLFTADKWWNAHESFDFTDPKSYVAALENMQIRKAMNGVELGLGNEGLELWVSFSRLERVRLLMETFRELAQSGIVTPFIETAGINTTGVNTLVESYNQQILFGTQPNPVFGRMKVKGIHGMRSDLACIVAPRPSPLPQYSAFVYAHGGAVGQYAIQTDPAAMQADTVPHIAVYQWTQQSPMFFGGAPGTSAGDIGISMLLNEGFASVSGLCFEYLFSGSAS